MSVVSMLAALCALVSAGLWFWSARLKLVLPMGYVSGPPKEVEARMQFNANLNAGAAALTGLSVLLQGLAPLLG